MGRISLHKPCWFLVQWHLPQLSTVDVSLVVMAAYSMPCGLGGSLLYLKFAFDNLSERAL